MNVVCSTKKKGTGFAFKMKCVRNSFDEIEVSGNCFWVRGRSFAQTTSKEVIEKSFKIPQEPVKYRPSPQL